MNTRLTHIIGAALAAFLIAPSALAQDEDYQPDVERGRMAFRECARCHSFYDNPSRRGPTLIGVFGRQAGTLPDFAYSKAIRESGIIWTRETIKAWISDPVGFIPGSRKLGHSLQRPHRLDDLVAYLEIRTDPDSQ